MNLIVNDLHVALQQEGQGPAIVFLHGWRSDHSTFAGIIQKLKKNFSTIAIDLPGFGGSQLPPESWGIEDYAKLVADALEKMEIDSVHALITHSLGGRVAIWGTANHVLRAKKMVLISSHGINKSDSIRNKSFKVLAKTGKAGTAIMPKSVQNKAKSKLYKIAGSEDYMLAGEMKQVFKNVIARDVRKDASTVPTQTLLIYGDQDEITPPEFGETFAELIEHSHLEVVKGAGHFVHIEKPNAVNELIGKFI